MAMTITAKEVVVTWDGDPAAWPGNFGKSDCSGSKPSLTRGDTLDQTLQVALQDEHGVSLQI